MVKIDSGECIWEFAQKMQSSDMGLIQINPDGSKTRENQKKQKKQKNQKDQCFQNYSDLWTSCQIFCFFVFFVFFGFLEFFFSDGAVVKCTDERGVHEADAWLWLMKGLLWVLDCTILTNCRFSGSPNVQNPQPTTSLSEKKQSRWPTKKTPIFWLYIV